MPINSLPVKDLISVRNVRSDVTVDDAFVGLIREHGVIEPLDVYKDGDQWVVNNGHRRLKAAIKIGLKIVPINQIARPLSIEADVVRQVVVNSTQKPISYMDRARACQTLKDCGWKQVKIARQLGMSEADVSLALSAIKASPAVQEAVDTGKLAPSAVEPLLSLPHDVQDTLLPAAITARSVRKVTALVQGEKSRLGLAMKRVKVVNGETTEDPMLAVARAAIEEAMLKLKVAESIMENNPQISQQVKPTVKELLATATRLKKQVA